MTRPPTAPDLALNALLTSRMPPDADAATIEQVYARRATMRVDRALLAELLPAWQAQAPDPALQDALRRAVVEGLRYDAVFRERHGGRRYAYLLPGHRGRVILSHNGKEKIAGSRAILQALPRIVRPAVLPPEGHVFVDVDVQSAFPAIAAAVTHDAAMQADVAADIHRRVGERLVPTFADPRSVGKSLNNKLISGMTPIGVTHALREVGVAATPDDAFRIHAQWWARYPTFKAWVEWFHGVLTQRALAKGGLRISDPTGRVFSFCSAEVHGWKLDLDELDAEGGARSILSSLWRAAEGAILDRALLLLHTDGRVPPDLRLCVPMYDGALFCVPRAQAREGQERVEFAFDKALSEANVHTKVTIKTGECW